MKALDVAKIICEYSNYTLSNLILHKILYLINLEYVGLNNKNLIDDECFEAWDYGPVISLLYHKFKIFGSSNIRRVFFKNDSISEFNDNDIKFIREKFDNLRTMILKPWKLVGLTHRKGGGWSKNYVPNMNNIIPFEDIVDEFKEFYATK